MLRQKCSYRKCIETSKKPKSKKSRANVCNRTRTSKIKIPVEKTDI